MRPAGFRLCVSDGCCCAEQRPCKGGHKYRSRARMCLTDLVSCKVGGQKALHPPWSASKGRPYASNCEQSVCLGIASKTTFVCNFDGSAAATHLEGGEGWSRGLRELGTNGFSFEATHGGWGTFCPPLGIALGRGRQAGLQPALGGGERRFGRAFGPKATQKRSGQAPGGHLFLILILT